MKQTLETARLILRAFTPEDFTAFQSWAGNPVNVRYMLFGPNSEEQTRNFIAQTKPGVNFAVVLKDINMVIGSCGIFPDSENDTGEIAWILHISHWKHGYGTELGGELIRYGFEDLKLRRITAPCAAVNYGSYRVMERNGMRREALHRKAFWARVDKEWIDEAVYAILAEDYFDKSELSINIVPYAPQYRDDMLLCFLTAKEAIGKYAPDDNWRKPSLKDDLLNIEEAYTARGEMFCLAIDEHDRVVGMVGTDTVSSDDLWLKRLFIKPEMKNKGIGSKLLAEAERFASGKGVTHIHTRFANWYKEAAQFYPAKGFSIVDLNDYLVHMVKTIQTAQPYTDGGKI